MLAGVVHGAAPISLDGARRLSVETVGDSDRRQRSFVVEENFGELDAWQIEVEIDPVVASGGDVQVVAGLSLGLKGADAEPEPRAGDRSLIAFELREGSGRGAWAVWINGENVTAKMPVPRPKGWRDNGKWQHPNVFTQRDGSYRLRIVGAPDDDGTLLRFYFEYTDRPVEEHLVMRRVMPGRVGLYVIHGGKERKASKTLFSGLTVTKLTPTQARANPGAWEIVRDCLDLGHPAMMQVEAALAAGDEERAKKLLVEHLRTRATPKGQPPTVEHAHPDYRKIAAEVLKGRYGTLGWFSKFAKSHTDAAGKVHPFVLDGGRINWDRDTGHLNRHFHWVAMAKTYEETGNKALAKQFAHEVKDYVTREPFFWPQCPNVGDLNCMDGTLFVKGFMNTSNIGRRCELTWWEAFEGFRKAKGFDDEALLWMLVGFVRQARLIMNPTSFAAHDDGGAHTALALLQNAIMLPELRESSTWRDEAQRRWDIVLKIQFHADSSHCSLSTGYAWASICALENLVALYRRTGATVPGRFLKTLEKAYEHPMALTRPDQGNIDLNDGGWGLFDDRYRMAHDLFPHRQDFLWIGSKGAQGAPPSFTSVYYPNAGQYVMRTGWGKDAKYLFFDAGPWGASHGKQDALHVYTAFGSQLLARNAGRGDYSAMPTSTHTAQTFAFNTLTPDWLGQNRIPFWEREKWVGHNPPKRRWVHNGRFDYGEGWYDYGWFGSKTKVEGKHTRQVIFVKGKNAARDGYYVVIDTIEPKDDLEHTWRHPWHLQPDDIRILPDDSSIVTTSPNGAMRIFPADPDGNLSVQMMRGQKQPVYLGWRVYGQHFKEWNTPTYAWTTKGASTKAWVLCLGPSEKDFPVRSVSAKRSPASGDITLTIARADGGTDHVLRRGTRGAAAALGPIKISGDIGAVCVDGAGRVQATLDVRQ